MTKKEKELFAKIQIGFTKIIDEAEIMSKHLKEITSEFEVENEDEK
ncbi:hypothetical protein [Spiroplasma endosymbiont of Labia minor]